MEIRAALICELAEGSRIEGQPVRHKADSASHRGGWVQHLATEEFNVRQGKGSERE